MRMLYDGLGKPEEKSPRDKTNSVAVVTAALLRWMDFVAEKAKPFQPWWDQEWVPEKTRKRLQSKAIKLLEDVVLTEKIGGMNYFEALNSTPEEYRSYAGLFFTALLNKGKTKHLLITKETPFFEFLGYKLERGIIETYGNFRAVGSHATGGCIINYGTLDSFGFDTSGGVFINKGFASKFGFGANKGIFIKPPFFTVCSRGEIYAIHTQNIIGFKDFKYNDEGLNFLEKLANTGGDNCDIPIRVREYSKFLKR